MPAGDVVALRPAVLEPGSPSSTVLNEYRRRRNRGATDREAFDSMVQAGVFQAAVRNSKPNLLTETGLYTGKQLMNNLVDIVSNEADIYDMEARRREEIKGDKIGGIWEDLRDFFEEDVVGFESGVPFGTARKWVSEAIPGIWESVAGKPIPEVVKRLGEPESLARAADFNARQMVQIVKQQTNADMPYDEARARVLDAGGSLPGAMAKYMEEIHEQRAGSTLPLTGVE
jgi:hypothetical protein